MPPREGFGGYVLEKAKLIGGNVTGVGEEGFPGVFLVTSPAPITAKIDDSSPVGGETTFDQITCSGVKRIAPRINDFGPNLLAFIDVDQIAHLLRKLIVIALRETW